MPASDEYLSHCKKYYLTANCAGCNRPRKNYSVPDMLAKIGDCQVAGLKTTIGNLWGCDKVYSLGDERCYLRVEIGGLLDPPEEIMPMVELKMQKFGAWRASEAMSLGNISSGSHLYGACKCGHTGYIRHTDLLKKYGPTKTLGELKHLLRCKRNDEHQALFFGIKWEER